MKTREQIITSMCYTKRHDFGLPRSTGESGPYPFPSGMTEQERTLLYKEMSQIFDNDIAPYMEFKE